jgi:MoaA/NifB/PqqE/SkfB family radical SAM enzyme
MGHIFQTLAGFAFHHPTILYHQPTFRCDCKCSFCDTWKGDGGGRRELTSQELKAVLKRFKAAGYTTYSAYGGEPLCYPGMAEVIAYASELGLRVILCTNGSRLREFSGQLARHSYYILLSLDAAGEKHDRSRNHPGLFAKALAGAEAVKAQKTKTRIIIWSNLNQLNRDQVPDLARLAKQLGVFIEFFPVVPLLGCDDRLVLSAEDRREVFEQVMEMKRKNYPVFNTFYSLRLMKNSEKFRCNMPRTSLRMLWDGSLWPCEARMFADSESYGSALNIDLQKLASTPEFQKHCAKLQNCNLCLFPCVAHYANNLWLQGGRRFFSEFYYRHIYSFE